MIKDEKGQMSVEVLFLFALSIMILIAFTIPISQLAIENNLDTVESLNTKSELLKLVNSIDNVYCQGEGAKQIITLESNKDFTVLIKSKSISSQISLHDGKVKRFYCNHKADNVFSNLKVSKGVTKILITWPQNSKNIYVNKI